MVYVSGFYNLQHIFVSVITVENEWWLYKVLWALWQRHSVETIYFSIWTQKLLPSSNSFIPKGFVNKTNQIENASQNMHLSLLETLENKNHPVPWFLNTLFQYSFRIVLDLQKKLQR